MEREELARKIFEISHLRGEFKLRSGQTSKEYFDKYRFESEPRLLRQIAKHMTYMVPDGTQALAALEMGGIPIATAISLETNIPVVYVRKEAKQYGTCKLAEGLNISGLQLCVIEDVITTGGQVIESTQALRQLGANIDQVLCVIYRGDGEPENLHNIGLTTRSLFTMNELKNSR